VVVGEIDDDKDAEYAGKRVPGRFYISRSFAARGVDEIEDSAGRAARFAYTVMAVGTDAEFRSDGGLELVLRETGSRQQLKALFFEDDRAIPTLIFQRFDKSGRRMKRESFSLRSEEIAQLETFLQLVRSPGLALDGETSDDRIRVSPELARQILRDESGIRAFLSEHPDVLRSLLENDVNAPDITALAHRRAVLEEFGRLLTDREFFEAARLQTKDTRPESVWQRFIEAHPWLLGASVATQFLHSWSPKKLEQTVKGFSLSGPGKRADAVMRTAGAISALVLVEIKHHQTDLLIDKPYRPGVWKVSAEVAAGVAQCQATTDEAIREAGKALDMKDEEGYTIGSVFVCRPRSVFIVGSLDQFRKDDRTHHERFESFERFRRGLRDPEILTFDELFERARYSLDVAQEQTRDGTPVHTEDVGDLSES
jgi:hypothetical protein